MSLLPTLKHTKNRIILNIKNFIKKKYIKSNNKKYQFLNEVFPQIHDSNLKTYNYMFIIFTRIV